MRSYRWLGGAILPVGDAAVISQSFGPNNLLWLYQALLRTAQDIFVLDKTFFLIEGHPAYHPHTRSAVTHHKPQISPLRFAPVEMTKLGVVANQAFLNPIFIPLGWGRRPMNALSENHPGRTALPTVVVSHPCYARMGHPRSALVWIQNRHQSRVPHLWRALCARCGKPQISPLRFAPVEMTKLGVVASQAFFNPIFIPLGGAACP